MQPRRVAVQFLAGCAVVGEMSPLLSVGTGGQDGKIRQSTEERLLFAMCGAVSPLLFNEETEEIEAILPQKMPSIVCMSVVYEYFFCYFFRLF